MDPARASAIAHTRHPIAAPVPPERVDELAGWCPGRRAVDLGCGSGEWLMRWLQRWPDAVGTGVDISADALGEATAAATRRGLGGRAHWVGADAQDWRGDPVDMALCVGATHALGGLDATLAALAGLLEPGGRALLGDGFWERPPSRRTQEVLEASPGELPTLQGLLEACETAGFAVTFAYVSSRGDWQDYEFAWTGSLTEWAVTAAVGVERDEALALARRHRAEWLDGYRDELGFATVALIRG